MFHGLYESRQRKRQQQRRQRRHMEKTNRASRRRLQHELLEDRRMFALVGVAPLDSPIIGFDSSGTVSYNATTDAYTLSAIPLAIDTAPPNSIFYSGTLNIGLQVDGAGAFVDGVAGDDFVLTGDVDVDGDFNVDYFEADGPLLTGEILAFGSEDSGGTTDLYDFRIAITGGQLAFMYAGKDLGVTTSSENSTFTGDFGVDFHGNAKGTIGAIDQLNPGIDIEKLTNGVDADDPRDAPEIVAGDPVTFSYQVTNTGNVAFAYNDVVVTDDSGTPGDASDDVSTTSGQIVLVPGSDVGGDLILSPGEVWIYEYTTTALDLDPSEDNCGCEVGIYENVAVVTVPGATDSDLSHYTNPSDAPPCIGFDSGGAIDYNAATDHFSMDALPIANEDGGLFFSGSVNLDIIVDGAGMLVDGVPGDDFVLTGDYDADNDFNIDYFEADGPLLTGEIIAFVATDSGGTTDTYEFRIMVTGGQLAALYVGKDLLIKVSSENSTFTGDFGANFHGNAKGDICCVCQEVASLSGHKYTDQTGDGISGDDSPLAGVTINLYQDFGTIGALDGADVLYASDLTDINGEYSFDMLPPGKYLVEEIVPAGYIPTTSTIYAVMLMSGDHVTTGFDFANFQLGSISGKKFQDNNGDGIQNGSDAGLAGWTIELDKDANGSVDFMTVTGAGGTYSFTGLTAGVYRIREVGQVGWTQTTVNPGDVSVVSGTNSTGNDFGNRLLVPGIDIEKTTNGPTNTNPTAPDYDNEDSANGPGVPILTPGSIVTWTYMVTNTGETDIAGNQVVIVDDNGTPGNNADDLSTTNGQITFLSVQTGDADNILEPGEVWLYTASGTVQSQGSGAAVTFNFAGNTALDGTDGNIRTFTSGGVSVKTSAWSRDTSGNWAAAWLGSYSGGLGVTDNSEGDGSNNNHTVDNIGRDNYVLFEFSESVVVDSAYLGYVVDDSDMRIWIGTKTDPFNNHLTLSDAVLASLGFTEVNETTLTTARLADLNAAGIAGNVLIIAANTGEATTEDKFKIQMVTVNKQDCYENKAVVTVPGATDFDLSHYCASQGQPGIDIEKFTNGVNADTESESPQIAPGATVTWTYQVTNTGTTAFTSSQIVVTDDNGTTNTTSDDFLPTRILSTDVGNDGILSPGEVWTYQATGIAQNLAGAPAATFNFSGSSSITGTAGNIRTFSAGGVSVKASAFSRDTSGVWANAYLGSYGGGLGVTDSSENGTNDTHTVDNIGRDNYVLFEFSDSVIIDSAFLGYVVDDSDLRYWIGTATDPFINHLTLSDAVLASLGFTEVNETTLTTARTANLNAGGIAGNVLVIAANTGEPTTEDKFKIEKLTFEQHVCYQNYAVVTTGPAGPTDSDVSHYCNPTAPPVPGIDIEKFTNGIDADNPADAPEIAPGDTVTWTYKVKNTGTVAFAASEVVVTDDNGTSSTSDDFSPTLVTSTDVGNDGILSPGETWTYTYSASAQEVLVAGASSTVDLSGSSSVTGTAGNIRTFSAGGVSVKTSAFSRDTNGAWSTAYLGSYSGGLGVTDGSENGTNDTHTVDNIGRDNYVLFEFSQSVVVDAAFLGYVVDDSDMRIWIGTKTDPFNNHLTLSDSVLASLGFTEVNETTLTTTRLADLNAGGIAGNVLVIAANTGEPTREDRFKIEKLTFSQLESGVYKNIGKVVVGGVSDQDVSHYRNPDSVNVSYAFAGNTAVTGTKGNILTYTLNNTSVKVSAFSRTTAGAWTTAYVGAYADGLGVTDASETGKSGTNRIDNIGQVNFMLFEFSTQVTVDRAYLNSVVGDSDVSVWIGTVDNPFHNHLTLSDASAGFMSYADINSGGNSARWADFNPDGVSGNVLVISASVIESSPNDQFLISKLDVAAKATKFFVVDPTADNTFEYGPTGQGLANYNLNSANTNARGVDANDVGNRIWVIDGSKKVYVYDQDGKLLGSWTANGLTTPEDIATNGTDIWIVDDGSNKVFKYAGAATRISGSQSAASSFALNSANANAKGITTNGTNLWVVNDSSTDKVFKYTMSGSLVGSWTIDSQNGSPTGLTIDPTNVNHIWIVDSADAAVYRYNAAASRSSGSQTAAGVFQLASGNTNAQGIADPPPTGDGALIGGANLLSDVVNGIKDRVLADWFTPSSINNGRFGDRGHGAMTLRANRLNGVLPQRTSMRVSTPQFLEHRNGDYLSAVDRVFADDEVRGIGREDRKWTLANMDLTAFDAITNDDAVEASAEAIR